MKIIVIATGTKMDLKRLFILNLHEFENKVTK
jgi:hypothetical protein